MAEILHLTLKKKWFDMILSGEKKEEYREDKQYWRERLLVRGDCVDDARFFNEVHFTNGYGKDKPFMRVECIRVTCGQFKPEWSDGVGGGFIIKLGEILETKNIKR